MYPFVWFRFICIYMNMYVVKHVFLFCWFVRFVTGNPNGGNSARSPHTALRPRPVGPAIHSAQRSLHSSPVKHVLSVGVRNQNLVASFSSARRSCGSACSEGTYLFSGTPLTCSSVVPPPPHSFPFYLFRFPAQTQFSNWDFKAFQFRVYPVKALRFNNKDLSCLFHPPGKSLYFRNSVSLTHRFEKKRKKSKRKTTILTNRQFSQSTKPSTTKKVILIIPHTKIHVYIKHSITNAQICPL